MAENKTAEEILNQFNSKQHGYRRVDERGRDIESVYRMDAVKAMQSYAQQQVAKREREIVERLEEEIKYQGATAVDHFDGGVIVGIEIAIDLIKNQKK